MNPDLSKKDVSSLLKILRMQNQRINRLEKEVITLKESVAQGTFAPSQKLKQKEETSASVQKTRLKTRISFTAFITTAGIIGLIIALVSFFSYAISNHWIGPLGQILIGIFVGLVLFFLGYKLYDSYPKWSVTSFGGAIFIEYLSIGFGVWYYKNIDPAIAFVGLLVFTVLGLLISLKYDSQLVAYFSLVGGFIMPIVAHMHDLYPVFMFLFLLVLVLGVLALSFYKDWGAMRFLTYLFLIGYEYRYYTPFGRNYSIGHLSPVLSLVFLCLFFIIYNLVAVIYSIKSDKKISAVDIVTLNINTFASSLFLTYIVDVDVYKKSLGAAFVALSFLFLLEVAYIKRIMSHKVNILPTLYSLFSSGLILLNIGIILILSTGDLIRLIILLLPQWALYTYLSSKPNDSRFYEVFSYIFFAFIAFWWIMHIDVSHNTTARGTFIILMMLAFLGCLFLFLVKDINKKFCGFVFVLFGFGFWYSFLKYVSILIPNMSKNVQTTILSGIWLAYSLLLYVKERDKGPKSVKILALILLILTLVKIAFSDLLKLPSGLTRIIGFTVFGILLLIGGLMLKND